MNLAALCLFGFLLAVWMRWRMLPFAQVYSDSLSPFAAATKALNTGWSAPPNPESDHWLWIASLPMLWLSSSLEGVFALRFTFGALIVPISVLILFLFQKEKWVLWSLILSLLLSVDSGLIEGLVSAFRGYMAPEFFALATLGYALYLRGYLWGAVLATLFTVIATGNHPLAIGTLLPLIWMHIGLWRRSKAMTVLSILVGGLTMLPRLIWTVELLQCDAGGLQCLQNIALSSSEQISVSTMLFRILHDRFWIEMGMGGPLLLLGCVLDRRHPLAGWVLLSALGIVLLGIGVSTLRPYHFRVLIVPLTIWSLSGWARQGKWPLIVFPIWFWGLSLAPQPVAWRNTVQRHDEIAGFLCTQEKPFWLEGYQDAKDLVVSLQGIGIAMDRRGCDELISSMPNDNLLLLSTEHLPMESLYNEGGIQIVRVTEEEIRSIPKENLLSGHDLATLFYEDASVELKW